MYLNEKLLKDLVKEVLEEGKGDSTKFMRRRKASIKHKEKLKRQDLEKLSSKELYDIAAEERINVIASIHDTSEQVEDKTIDAILASQED